MFFKKRKCNKVPHPEAVEQARLNPGGWVYEIDSSLGTYDDAPPEAIIGAWKVGDDGKIIGDYIPNPSYGGSMK